MNTLYIIQLNHCLYRTTNNAAAWDFCLTYDAQVVDEGTVTYTIDSITT